MWLCGETSCSACPWEERTSHENDECEVISYTHLFIFTICRHLSRCCRFVMNLGRFPFPLSVRSPSVLFSSPPLILPSVCSFVWGVILCKIERTAVGGSSDRFCIPLLFRSWFYSFVVSIPAVFPSFLTSFHTWTIRLQAALCLAFDLALLSLSPCWFLLHCDVTVC